MERSRVGKNEGGVYLPDDPQEARALAAAELTEADGLLAKGDQKSARKAQRLRGMAERHEMRAFELAEKDKNYEMMGASIVGAMEIRLHDGDVIGARGLSILGLGKLKDRAPDFTDQIREIVRKIDSRYRVNSVNE